MLSYVTDNAVAWFNLLHSLANSILADPQSPRLISMLPTNYQ